MPSVRKIAKELGVSVATVSRAMNNHPDVSVITRQRVLEAAQQMGYAPSVRKQQSNVIGLVYPGAAVRADYGGFESMMLAGILRGANERGYDLTIINLRRDKDAVETYTQFFHRKGVRGVLIRALDATPNLVSEIAADGVPHVVIADRSEDRAVNYIDSESRSTSREAVEHLLSLGHDRIALGIHNVLDSDHRDRRTGYEEALTKAGIPIDERLIVTAPGSPEGGAIILNHLLSLDLPPTAIYFTNPLSTVGAMHRCLQLGLHVPDDLSIVGFDDGEVRLRTFPPYTAVCQDAETLGLAASRWVISALDADRPMHLREMHPTRLCVHESSGIRPTGKVRLDPALRSVVRG